MERKRCLKNSCHPTVNMVNSTNEHQSRKQEQKSIQEYLQRYNQPNRNNSKQQLRAHCEKNYTHHEDAGLLQVWPNGRLQPKMKSITGTSKSKLNHLLLFKQLAVPDNIKLGKNNSAGKYVEDRKKFLLTQLQNAVADHGILYARNFIPQ